MADTSGKVEIIVQVVDKASRGINKVKSTLSQVSKAQEIYRQKLEEFNGTQKKVRGELSNYIKALVTARVAFEALRTTVDVSKFRVLEESFKRLASGVGEDADAILEAMERATRGTVDRFEAMRLANKAIAAGLPVTAEEMGKLALASRRLAQTMGMTVQEAFTRLVEGIAKGEPELLDELGLVVSREDAYRRYAQQLGKTTAQLTKQEQVLAFYNAVLQKIDPTLKALGPDHDTLADAMARLRNQLSYLKFDFISAITGGESLKDTIDGLVSKIKKLRSALHEQRAAISQSAKAMLGLAKITIAVKTLQKLRDVAKFTVAEIKALNATLSSLSGTAGALGKSLSLIGAAIAGWQIGKIISEIKIAGKSIGEWVQVFYGKVALLLENIRHAFVSTFLSLKLRIVSFMRELQTEVINGFLSILESANMIKGIEKLIPDDAIESLRTKQKALSDSTLELQKALEEENRRHEYQIEIYKTLLEELDRVSEKKRELRESAHAATASSPASAGPPPTGFSIPPIPVRLKTKTAAEKWNELLNELVRDSSSAREELEEQGEELSKEWENLAQDIKNEFDASLMQISEGMAASLLEHKNTAQTLDTLWTQTWRRMRVKALGSFLNYIQKEFVTGVITNFEKIVSYSQLMGLYISKGLAIARSQMAQFASSLASILPVIGRETIGVLRSAAALILKAVGYIIEKLSKMLGPGALLAAPPVIGGIMALWGSVKKKLGFAEGGFVRGPSGRDNVLAFLTAGEYVLRKDVVERYGKSFFDELNRGFIPFSTHIGSVNITITVNGGTAELVDELEDILSKKVPEALKKWSKLGGTIDEILLS